MLFLTYDIIQVACFYPRQRVWARLRVACVHSSTLYSYVQNTPDSWERSKECWRKCCWGYVPYTRSIFGVLYSRYCEYSKSFEVLYYYLRYYYCVCVRARIISGLGTFAVVDTPCCASSILGFCTAGTASTSLAAFSPLVVFVLLLRVVVLATPKYPQYAQSVHLENKVSLDRLCTVSTSSQAHCSAQISPR